ncbi:FitA-like ribbon-helix-helix domain-containing protein [Pseudaminobacter soli (ex Zhang et al. 2022)]|nr:plasmid stabilization protein [Pseudaminobacter soli]
MLIRDLDPELKRQIEERSRRNRRSLSEEAIDLIRRGILVDQKGAARLGDRLRAIIGDVHFTDEELDAIAASRAEPDREPPSFA